MRYTFHNAVCTRYLRQLGNSTFFKDMNVTIAHFSYYRYVGMYRKKGLLCIYEKNFSLCR